jgi:hypothetical protein
MATTPNGLPYPVGTDQVKDGDNAIQALAVAADKADTIAWAGAQLASAGISTGRTGWGITATNADPSGRLTIGSAGITTVKAGLVWIQFAPILTTSGSVTYAIVLTDPNAGPVYAQTVYSPGGAGTRLAGLWPLAAGQSVHPVFLSSSSGSSCGGGYFEVAHHGARSALA